MRAFKLSQLPPHILSRLLRLVRSRWVNFRRRRVSLPVWKAKGWIRRVRRGPDSTPLVSVIIPAHNAAATLARIIHAI